MLTYPSISDTEISKAYNLGMAALADFALQDALQDSYAIDDLVCEKTTAKNCLYLYLYALNSWNEDEGAFNFLTEKELIQIIAKIEQLYQICCSDTEEVELELAPALPLVSNGTWIEADVNNPATISELAIATTGSLLWYTVATGGTGSISAPVTPDTFPGLYHYWVSQTGPNGESRRLPVDVTILPQPIGVSNYTVCQSLTVATHNMVFTGLDMGGVLNVYLGNTIIGTSLTVDLTIPQNVNYQVSQTVVGLEGPKTPFTVLVRPAPITSDPISGDTSPVVNDVKTYTIPAIAGAASYIWTLPAGITGSSTTNSIDLTFVASGSKTIKVKGVSADGCIGTEVSLVITVGVGLLPTHFTVRSNESFVGRVYSVRQHIQSNPGDTVTITRTIVDNPVGAIVTVTPLAIVSAGTDIYTTVTVDGSASFLGGTVIVQLNIVSSALGSTIDSPSVVTLSIPFDPVPHCPAGYTLSMDETYCYKIETMAPTVTNPGYCVAESKRIEYSQVGTRIYNPGFANSSISTYTPPAGDIYATMNVLPQWRGNDGTNGPMNRAGVWIDSDCDGTKDSLVAGQQVTLSYAYTNPGASKTVYVGVGADNQFTLKVNDTTVATASGSYDIHFKIWHIFPVIIPSGTSYFNVVATGDGSVNDSVGMIIYDNTAAQIAAATSDASLTILFSTGSLIGGTIDVATCLPGWILDVSGGPGSYICKRILTTPPII